MVAAPGLVAMLVVLGCLAGLVILWIRVLRQTRGDGSRCGACGYAVEGLETMCCPECGGDFRKVGIATPTARRVRPAIFFGLWTLLLPVPALVVSALTLRLVPHQQAVTHNLSVQPNSMSFPAQMLLIEYQGATRSRLNVTGTSITTRGDGSTSTTTLTFPTIAGGRVEIARAELRPTPTGGFRSISPGTRASGPVYDLPTEPGASIDKAAMIDWLRAQASTPAEEQMLALDADELAGLTSSILGGQAGYATTRLIVSGSATSSGRARSPTWALALIVGFWTLVYAGGCVLFATIRRRRTAKAAPT